jgi:ABC-type multidrug transport system fused ATPase/permease subunit
MNGSQMEDGSKQLAGPIKNLRFERISFRYQEDSNEIFDGLSLELPVGSKIAFVGFSGGGKSTVVQLVARFFEPQAGRILVNQNDLREISRESWMNRLAIVFQEPYLFPDTIKNNLLFGSEDISEERLVRACMAAEIYDQIQELPEGIDTMVGERGIQLSGGQRQRLAIARALLRNPEILILDEATSALDMETERQVFQHLDRDYPGVTKIIIAHRLSTIENANHIFVLDKGRVVEQGTHEQLLKRASLYKSLVVKQNEMGAAELIHGGI